MNIGRLAFTATTVEDLARNRIPAVGDMRPNTRITNTKDRKPEMLEASDYMRPRHFSSPPDQGDNLRNR